MRHGLEVACNHLYRFYQCSDRSVLSSRIEKIVEKFWKLNLIKLPQDIFKLDFKKIENLEGWGKQSMENLKYSINQRKYITLERLIYSLGIRHIGLENAKILSKYFKSFSK